MDLKYKLLIAFAIGMVIAFIGLWLFGSFITEAKSGSGSGKKISAGGGKGGSGKNN